MAISLDPGVLAPLAGVTHKTRPDNRSAGSVPGSMVGLSPSRDFRGNVGGSTISTCGAALKRSGRKRMMAIDDLDCRLLLAL